MTQRATPNVRHKTTETLVERHGWSPGEASAWANSTADTADEIRAWRDAGYTPRQALVIYAAADHEPTDWRDLELSPDLTNAYTEAGFTYDEVVDREDTSERPDSGTFDFLRALNRPKVEAAISAFKSALRDDSEYAELDGDW